MEINNTNSIKGIFVWLIIFRHKTSYGNFQKFLFIKINNYLSSMIVSVFFFYSGFGIFESIKKKGINYTKFLLFKAIIIFIKSEIMILLFLVTNLFIFHNKITLKRFFLTIIFKSAIGNSNWFAFTIIMFYFYSYISFRFIKQKITFGIVIISILCIFHIILVYNYYFPKIIFMVDNVLCFLVGFYYSLTKIYIDKLIMKNDINYYITISISIFWYHRFFIKYSLIGNSIRNFLFVLIIVLISVKVKFNNDFLIFLNSHSYSIYLLQKLDYFLE